MIRERGWSLMCPECGAQTFVLETRPNKDSTSIRRRRQCLAGHRFTTAERPISSTAEDEDR